MAPERDDTSNLQDLGEVMAELTAPMSAECKQRGFTAVSVRLARRRRRRLPMFGLGALGLAAGATACVLWLFATSPRAITGLAYQTMGGEILDGGYLKAFGDVGMSLRFAEGTKLELMPGARGRLLSVDANGARLAIEQGAASVDVVHRPGAHWLVDAGPFLITVKGTQFTVSWDPVNEQLDLRMKKGLVSVTGPLSEGAIAVRAGQGLAINLPGKQVFLQEMGGVEAEGTVPVAQAAVPSQEPEKAASSEEAAAGRSREAPFAAPRAQVAQRRSAVRRPGPDPQHGWAAALAAGDMDSILQDVEKVGLQRALAEASSEDLSALADAARYRRREEIARQALLSQRNRFADSPRALDAAFLLGRLEDASQGGGKKALEWYDRYLEGAPNGSYASEALGRKMIATQKLQGTAAAQSVAAEYLRRFPTGTYAGTARALRQTP